MVDGYHQRNDIQKPSNLPSSSISIQLLAVAVLKVNKEKKNQMEKRWNKKSDNSNSPVIHSEDEKILDD